LLDVTVRELRRRHPGVEIEVLSGDPQATARRYGVEAVPRMDVRAVRQAIERASMLLSGGGGLLQNATSTRSLLYYAGIIKSALAARKPAMIFAQSIGPLDLIGRVVVREMCRGLTAATVRDTRSQALLSRLVPKVPVERTADPVWMLEPDGEKFDLNAEGLGPESDPIAVVSVRKIPGYERGTAVLAAAVDRLAQRGARVAFLPLGGAPDAEASATVIRACKSAPTLLPAFEIPKAVHVIGRARVVIGMRLHALIIAARLGVPFLPIPYDPKVSALCEELAWPLEPLWDPLKRTGERDPVRAARLVDRLWDERDALHAELVTKAQGMRALAERNFNVLDDILAR
jgi:polysaccharide pyruvyl transferase CsaB